MALQNIIKQQIQQKGNTYSQGAPSGKSEWEKIIAQMLAAQKMDSGTMAGFALGKLLRSAFDDWKENYDARGDLNRLMEIADPQERARRWAFLQQVNPEQAARTQKYADKRGFDLNGGGGNPQAELAQGLLSGGAAEQLGGMNDLDWEERLRQMGLMR